MIQWQNKFSTCSQSLLKPDLHSYQKKMDYNFTIWVRRWVVINNTWQIEQHSIDTRQVSLRCLRPACEVSFYHYELLVNTAGTHFVFIVQFPIVIHLHQVLVPGFTQNRATQSAGAKPRSVNHQQRFSHTWRVRNFFGGGGRPLHMTICTPESATKQPLKPGTDHMTHCVQP